MNKKQRSCDGREARSAPFGVAISPKRRERAAQGAHAGPKLTSEYVLQDPNRVGAGQRGFFYNRTETQARRNHERTI